MYALLHKTMRYQWGFRYLFFIIKLDNFFWQILLQDKYNIGVLYKQENEKDQKEIKT
jgi:hypothetical protein